MTLPELPDTEEKWDPEDEDTVTGVVTRIGWDKETDRKGINLQRPKETHKVRVDLGRKGFKQSEIANLEEGDVVRIEYTEGPTMKGEYEEEERPCPNYRIELLTEE